MGDIQVPAWDLKDRAELNQRLRARDRAEIAERTFRHYNKLRLLGYTEYISINRLDIRHANDSVFDIADRSRYGDRVVAVASELVVPTRDTIRSVAGTVIRLSDGFATLRVDKSDMASTIARATKYNHGILVFSPSGIEQVVRVVEGAPTQPGSLDLLLEFRSLLETDLILGRPQQPIAANKLTVDLGAQAPLSILLESVHTSFDLLESARGMVDVFMVASDRHSEPVISTRVDHLAFSNPLEAIFVTVAGAAGIVAYVLQRVARAAGDASDAVTKSVAAANASENMQLELDLKRTQLRSMQLSNLKSEIELRQLIAAAGPSIETSLGQPLPDLGQPQRAQLDALKDQAVEAAADLMRSSKRPIEFTPVGEDGH